MIKYVFSKIMINFLNDFEQEQPACQPWSLVPILCVLVGLMTLIAIAFLAKYINKTQNKKQQIQKPPLSETDKGGFINFSCYPFTQPQQSVADVG